MTKNEMKEILMAAWTEKCIFTYEEYEKEIDSQIVENDFSEYNKELLGL